MSNRYDKLHDVLEAKDFNVRSANLDEATLFKMARNVEVEPLDYVDPPSAELVRYTNGRKETNLFIRTPKVRVGSNGKGLAVTRGNEFIRRDVAQALADHLLAGLAIPEDQAVEEKAKGSK